MANFESAWFVYGVLLLLLATSLVVRIEYARIGLAAAALVALPLTLFRGGDVGYGLLVLAILAINIGILARLWLGGANIRFTAEEEELRRQHFPGLGAMVARDLIDQGNWISARRGEVLIRENQAAPSLFYLAEGKATILRDGVEIGKLSDGALIGEATVLDGTHATGTVLLGTNARLWFVPAAALRAYLAANPGIAGALHEGFARALRGKLASANTRIADRPSIS
ncbi:MULTISPECIES: cyclic nucleotide-binding domain-containing protein [unclassified Sphingopyxis]|jgi:CRP/FNR family transcriptional regulator, cyclic AMP receptor protein|uniref:cyclic nucleotide-binding domain-containing protein n=1 Tax=unclassified Sphingopyxis TaxID=2614943 RepID=UPI0006C5C122|nr:MULTISPECIES: cyclic nucleotide-binding domain-containing protein [unclassified Sphingopyxis]USI76015.1 cyclic nucleotide-binding domain-containing protein [Sphingopyxis sp. USTB-05]GAO77316.1 cyclic nucleotide-binding domain protein [Sphingopyxis sp. C-1]